MPERESDTVKPPAPNPCGSCPYRRDVPSGVWAEEEYAKLPLYDKPTGYQPPNVFMCHQQDGRLCAGWVGCHDMNENLGLRILMTTERIDPEDLDPVFDYTTPVELFSSGVEAAIHGRAKISAPDERAGKTIDKLTKRQARGRDA